MSTDSLIDAAEKYAEQYKDDPRDGIATDVMNAFYAGHAAAKAEVKVEMDTDGENRAVRAFLLLYSAGATTIQEMRHHMSMSGHDNHWPDWAATSEGYLTELGAQNGLRYLFSLFSLESQS